MYLFAKWLHIIAVISWMAGILYLYRLFIYHRERGPGEPKISELLEIMEMRLYRYITLPAMIVAWIAAIMIIVSQPDLMRQGWLHGKILFVLALTMFTTKGGKMMRRLKNLDDTTLPTGKKLRVLNEVPTILMLIIVALVVFRPW
jgi:protoporphyrinogen IX oxidase